MSYYFNFLDHELAYRKNLGLTGYFLALLYSFSLLFINPERYFSGFFENLISYDFILGLGAMGILTLMAVVSNNFVMRKIGAHAWRVILRLGYVAYFLLILRAVVLEGDSWLFWFQSLDNLPPPRLLISIFAVIVIALRVSMEISLRSKNLRDKSLPAGEAKENKG
jgi:DMSO/TMAO reductase YedYZ heme-binding membrane subunit